MPRLYSRVDGLSLFGDLLHLLTVVMFVRPERPRKEKGAWGDGFSPIWPMTAGDSVKVGQRPGKRLGGILSSKYLHTFRVFLALNAPNSSKVMDGAGRWTQLPRVIPCGPRREETLLLDLTRNLNSCAVGDQLNLMIRRTSRRVSSLEEPHERWRVPDANSASMAWPVSTT